MTETEHSQKARRLLAEALGIPLQRAKELSSMYDIPEWDSEGQLCIILALEECTGREIRDETLFEQLTEVSEIIAFLLETAQEKDS